MLTKSECTTCAHVDVCSLKKDYEKNVGLLAFCVNGEFAEASKFDVTLRCLHYQAAISIALHKGD